MPNPTPADIENLIELFNRSDWDEMHLKTDTLEIFLSNDPQARRPGQQVAAPVALAAAPAAVAASPAASPVAAAAAPAAKGAHEVVVPAGMVAVRAPNLGTFYRSPKPGAPAYVEVGQTITADTEVCLIEVMKLFTPVKAGVAGTVREICVADGTMVEYEQVLVIVEPAA
ncbi:MAG: acetyl-CoA carboxylase biotin carboxyl carrier protein [Gammaproteobacteria bacterium]|nr:acetyl-CoA carboxylase biotin carboxyl carrier protein [Gammaproteobacteria bacterium]